MSFQLGRCVKVQVTKKAKGPDGQMRSALVQLIGIVMDVREIGNAGKKVYDVWPEDYLMNDNHRLLKDIAENHVTDCPTTCGQTIDDQDGFDGKAKGCP